MEKLRKILEQIAKVIRVIFKLPIGLISLIPGLGAIGKFLKGLKTSLIAGALVILGVLEQLLDTGFLDGLCGLWNGFCDGGIVIILLGWLMGMLREVTNTSPGENQ